jgi:hypothetical protein
MAKVDFGGLKQKLMTSIVAISAIQVLPRVAAGSGAFRPVVGAGETSQRKGRSERTGII